MFYIKKPKVSILFLDLDGTVRKGFDQLGYFVNKAAEVEVFHEVPGILAAYKEAGWRVVGITNQGGVALGHLTFDDMALAIYETQQQCLGLFDRIMACTHHPDAKDPEYARCWCRKPMIGNLVIAGLQLAEQYGERYPSAMALMVGDRPEDKQCADNANINFMDAAEWRARGPEVYKF